MLRLKLALRDCKIPQKAVVDATGFGKTQVSLTLSTGKLPADGDKFANGIHRLVSMTPALQEYLKGNEMPIEMLFDLVEETPIAPKTAPADLNTQLCTLAVRAYLDGGLSRGNALRLVKACQLLSLSVPVALTASAASILTGVEPWKSSSASSPHLGILHRFRPLPTRRRAKQ